VSKDASVSRRLPSSIAKQRDNALPERTKALNPFLGHRSTTKPNAGINAAAKRNGSH
jgi:hypothetical protein